MKSFLKKFYCYFNRKINRKQNTPLTRNFGVRRGTPIDRYFIDKKISNFLESLDKKKKKYRGLEIGGFHYLRRNSSVYEAFELVQSSSKGFKDNVICKDLNIPYDGEFENIEKFDFIVCTQVLNFVKDDINSLQVMNKLLNKNGIIIGSVTGMISPLSMYDYERWGAYRGYTDQGLKALFERTNYSINIETFGNFDLSCEFLNGSVVEDLDEDILNFKDPLFQTTHTFNALKNNI